MLFLFKQKTAYEMRISDWSSDVCSSDLFRRGGDDGRIASETRDQPLRQRLGVPPGKRERKQIFQKLMVEQRRTAAVEQTLAQARPVSSGTASGSERVCQYV